ncbi:hypothetical protein R5R35_005089 [Gryllus longicercus]|uniref:Uncharacterized protein n=1 Tax=Gryllus longicercus TaxID=2509291 RepID=A0AAN9VGU2_9ORTH
MDDEDLDMLVEAGGEAASLVVEDVTAAIAAIGGLPLTLNEPSVSGRRNILGGVYLIPSALPLPLLRWERKRRARPRQRPRRRRQPSFRPGSARAAARALTRRSIRWLASVRSVQQRGEIETETEFEEIEQTEESDEREERDDDAREDEKEESREQEQKEEKEETIKQEEKPVQQLNG